MVVLLVIFAFLARYGYFLAFELGPRGATPGKRLIGIRVASRDGGRLTAEAVIARNLLRDIELFLPLAFIQIAPTGAAGSGQWTETRRTNPPCEGRTSGDSLKLRFLTLVTCLGFGAYARRKTGRHGDTETRRWARVGNRTHRGRVGRGQAHANDPKPRAQRSEERAERSPGFGHVVE